MGGVAVNCMKCGCETKEDAVFCEECLDHMNRHPVPPNTLVYVPSEKDRAATKKHAISHPVMTSEEQIKRLNRRVHGLSLLVALLMGLVVFLGLLSLDTLQQLNVTNLIGKNYTTITSSATLD